MIIKLWIHAMRNIKHVLHEKYKYKFTCKYQLSFNEICFDN